MSIRKIAEMTGTSISTVSRVLNHPDYKCRDKKKRDEIWDAAMRIGYTPNEAARNLKQGKNASDRVFYVSIVMTRVGENASDPFFDELLRQVETQIHKNICILNKVWYLPILSDDGKCTERALRNVLKDMEQEAEHGSDGLIVIGKCNHQALLQLKKQYRHIVSVNRNSTNYEVNEVLCDGEKIAKMAVEHLVSLGHVRIGYVGDCQNEARYRGYRNCLQKHGLSICEDYMLHCSQTEASGYEAMHTFAKMENPPTGVYCANDILAIGLLKCWNQSYRKSRYAPSVIGSDNIDASEYSTPMLSTVALPKEEMAFFALKLLAGSMRGEYTSIVRVEVEGKLLVRNSSFPIGQT